MIWGVWKFCSTVHTTISWIFKSWWRLSIHMDHICSSSRVFYCYTFVWWTNIKSIFICWAILPVISYLNCEIFCLTISPIQSYSFKTCRKCNNIRIFVIPACLINLTIIYNNNCCHRSQIIIVTGRRNYTVRIVFKSNIDLPSRHTAYREWVSFRLSIIILTIIPGCNIIFFV